MYNHFDSDMVISAVKCNRSMKRSINLNIEGEPVAQGRPRFSNRGGFNRAYDPPKSKAAKKTVAAAAKKVMEGVEPLRGPIKLYAEFGIMLPKSQERKRNPVPKQWRTKKPDLDNFVKLVKDACSGIIYYDDNCVVEIHARKVQCAQGEAPYTRLRFEELDTLISSS